MIDDQKQQTLQLNIAHHLIRELLTIWRTSGGGIVALSITRRQSPNDLERHENPRGCPNEETVRVRKFSFADRSARPLRRWRRFSGDAVSAEDRPSDETPDAGHRRTRSGGNRGRSSVARPV